MNALSQYLDLYQAHAADIKAHAPVLLNDRRDEALRLLADARLPEKGQEKFPATSLSDMFAPDFGVNINRIEFPLDTAATFHCGIPNISTLLGVVVNDSFRATSTLQRNLPEGVILMSLAKAAQDHPDLVSKYLDNLIPADNVAAQLNSLLLQDGIFIYVPRGVVMQKPMQIVNVFNAVAPVMGIRRIIVVLEKGAQASLLICDHSQRQDIKYLSNQVVELYLDEDASLDYYDLEESSLNTSRLSQLFATQAKGSRLTVNGTTLIGGVTRNTFNIDINGDHAETHLVGMAIGADDQTVDNVTDIRHHATDCSSNQIFKYVLEDKSVGSFYGTIVVDEAALHTNAYQSNRNILASDNAHMYTRPQLEIYCDEVKCSHGATIGQLDANALFYMRSRGIPLAEARLMLMQAFMADVIDTVNIPALKTRLQQLVESRLNGNRVLCGQNCGNTNGC